MLFIAISTFGQEFVVTPEGLRDNSNNDKTYLVISTPNKTAEQNYNNALKYINKTYTNPKEVIKGDIKSEYLRFDTFVSGLLIVNNSGAKVSNDVKYTTTLTFKDDRVKYEISNLDLGGVTFTGSIWSGFPIYLKKKKKLKRPETKNDIELYFNTVIVSLKGSLLDSEKGDDW